MDVLLFLAGAFATAVIAWAVNRFAPVLFRRMFPPRPLEIHIETDPALIFAGAMNWVPSAWVLPSAQSPEEVGAPPTDVCRDWRRWMKPRGAYDGWWTEIQITLVGASDSTVVVDGIRARVEQRHDPVGIALTCPVGGADITVRGIALDLDVEGGLVTYEDDGGEPARAFAFSLRRGEVERFHIRARSSDQVLWKAELLLIVNGKRQTVTVDDDGALFRTSSVEKLTTWAWTQGKWSLTRPTL